MSVGWGEPVTGRGSTGTFRESWRLRWEPELFVKVAEAGVWGTTVLSAATAKAESKAVSATALAEVTTLAEQCLLAELPDALSVVMKALADRAALDADVGHLAQALPALARSLRYGDVRSTDTAALGEVATGLAERICVGLPPACTNLDADGAAEMRGHLDAVHTAIGLLPTAAELSSRWGSVLHRLAGRDTVPGVIRGRAARLLLDDGRLEEDEAARLMSLALSLGTPPAEAAAWIEGFVGGASGGGMLLVHDERLLGLVDAWLTSVPADAFTDVLPLLRRTFSAYELGVRRTLGELVRRGPAAAPGGAARPQTGMPGFGAGLDEERADAVLPVLADAARNRRQRPCGGGPMTRTTDPATQIDAATTDVTATDVTSTTRGGADRGRGDAGRRAAAPVAARPRRRVGGRHGLLPRRDRRGDRRSPDRALRQRRRTAAGDRSRGRSAGLGASAPSVARWLGDIRTYFPASVVQVMQRDAIDRLGLSTLLLEPEMLEAVEADVHLVGTLLSLNKAMPETTKETARAVVRKVVDDLEKQLATRTRSTLTGALDRSAKINRPASPGHRLGPHHPGEPQELPARVPHRRPRAADRIRAGVRSP